jgi:hypothetical protein
MPTETFKIITSNNLTKFQYCNNNTKINTDYESLPFKPQYQVIGNNITGILKRINIFDTDMLKLNLPANIKLIIHPFDCPEYDNQKIGIDFNLDMINVDLDIKLNKSIGYISVFCIRFISMNKEIKFIDLNIELEIDIIFD